VGDYLIYWYAVMEPTLPVPQSTEHPSAPITRLGDGEMTGFESASAGTPERVGELQPVMNPVPNPAQSTQLGQPTQQVQPVPQQAPQGVPQDFPMIADDVDVLEKEWVDKAKRIVSATKDDPHQQEKEVSKLQADYLMKRYNKKIKLAE
jgi:hypothetical protein